MRRFFIIILFLTLPCIVNAGWLDDTFSALPSRSASALSIPTYDGSNQPTHPSVVDFGAGNTWNGYRYWMAMTPLPASSNVYENPSILVSSNRTTWGVPNGLTNPIATPQSGYNADVCLFYDSASNQLWCYWIENTNILKRKTSSNGTTWSEEETCLTVEISVEGIASPSIIKDGSTYYMWVNDWCQNPNVMYLRQSTDGTTWTNKTACSFSGSFPSGQELWHMEAQWVESISEYIMLIQTTDSNITTRNQQLVIAHGSNKTEWTVESGLFITGGSNLSDWDHNVYKSSFAIDGSTMYIWYAGIANMIYLEYPSTSVWNIGYTTATLGEGTPAAATSTGIGGTGIGWQ